MEQDDLTLPAWRFKPIGEAAVLVEGTPSSTLTNRYVIALAAALERRLLPGFGAAVPGISSLLVHFDPFAISLEAIENALHRLLDQIKVSDDDESRLVTIPVQYGGAFGPDLELVASLLGLTPAEIVALHCGKPYRVLAIGFAPGFPYIGPVGSELTVARRATPRTAVPAGSVALAAGLTCVYPAQLPGGWHLIGRTTAQLFDPQASSPALLMAGDRIRFAPVTGGILP